MVIVDFRISLNSAVCVLKVGRVDCQVSLALVDCLAPLFGFAENQEWAGTEPDGAACAHAFLAVLRSGHVHPSRQASHVGWVIARSEQRPDTHIHFYTRSSAKPTSCHPRRARSTKPERSILFDKSARLAESCLLGTRAPMP